MEIKTVSISEIGIEGDKIFLEIRGQGIPKARILLDEVGAGDLVGDIKIYLEDLREVKKAAKKDSPRE